MGGAQPLTNGATMTEQGAIWRQTAQKWTEVIAEVTDDDLIPPS